MGTSLPKASVLCNEGRHFSARLRHGEHVCIQSHGSFDGKACQMLRDVNMTYGQTQRNMTLGVGGTMHLRQGSNGEHG